jgi:bacterial/archaeal transporter family-2 protein
MLDRLLPLLMIFGGLLLPTQNAVNGKLARTLGSPLAAAFCSCIVSLIGLGAALLLGVGRSQRWSAVRELPWWGWTGGLLGATFLTLMALGASRLGVLAVVACVLTGQLLGAMVLDQTGWLEAVQRPLTVERLAGVALLAAGAYLVVR